ncbi:MAG: glycoside hydrolase family 36 protein [Candidatus Borkfalkiaceae bacterium]|nr:glycoside hydrolase family 36 protein [Christensenellaceae bacterium]
MLKVFCENGKLNVLYRNFQLKGVALSVFFDGGHYNTLEEKSGEWKVSVSGGEYTATSGNFTVTFAEVENGFAYKSAYKAINAIKHALFFRSLAGVCDSGFERAVINGFSESNGNRFNEMQADPETVIFCDCKEKLSSDSAAIKDKNGKTFVVGAAGYDKYFTEVGVSACGEIFVDHPLDYHPVNAGDIIESDFSVVVFGENMQSALDNYALINRRFNPRGRKPTPYGWCSWYYYGPNISRDIILDNAARLKKAEVPIKYIQIDDGWQQAQGDWFANEKFGDMKEVADEISALGYTPAIWIAPFAASEKSRLYKDHSDWFVKNLDDDGIFGYPSIDFSNPAAAEWLKETFERISREWGYRYIKVDLVLHAISAGRHYDPSFNAVRNYRRAFEIINKAVTPDTYLLACTSPIGASIGVADGIRVSRDIFERWQSLKGIAAPVLKRFYYNKNLFDTDPDCFMARKAENEDGECFRLCVRTDDEIRMHASLIAASGGSVFFSDKVGLLSGEQIRLYKTLVPPANVKPVPLDYETSDKPSVVDCGKTGNTRTLIFFNWENGDKTVNFPLDEKKHAFGFWEQKYYGFISSLEFTLPPHTAKVFSLSDDADFVPSGKNDEIIPTFNYEKNGRTVTLKANKAGEKLFAYCGSGLTASDNCEVAALGENLYAITVKDYLKKFTVVTGG